MNDMLDLDAEIRAALEHEAGGVSPDTDDAWQRLEAASKRRRLPQRSLVVLSIAAAAVAVVFAAIALLPDDDTDVELGPATTAPTTGGIQTSTTNDATATSALPELFAIVRADGQLVVLDRDGHIQRELAFHGDPREAFRPGFEEGGPSYIDGVDLSPDGRFVYYSTCCEPAIGSTYRVPVAGGDPVRIADGALPRISDDGLWLAVSQSERIAVYGIAADGSLGTPIVYEVGRCCARDLAWAPSGTQIAFTNTTGGPDDTIAIEVLDFDGKTLSKADVGKPTIEGAFATWEPSGMLHVIAGGPGSRIEGLRSVSQDASYEWILETHNDGTMTYRRSDGSGEIEQVEGMPAAYLADW